MLFAHLRRVEPQVLRDPVHLDFLGPARLRSSVAAFRAAGSLVGEDSHGFKSIVRQFVGGWLKDAGIEGAGHAVASVGAAVQNRAMVHRSNGAVLLVSSLRGHEDGMPSAVGVEDFFTR